MSPQGMSTIEIHLLQTFFFLLYLFGYLFHHVLRHIEENLNDGTINQNQIANPIHFIWKWKGLNKDQLKNHQKQSSPLAKVNKMEEWS